MTEQEQITYVGEALARAMCADRLVILSAREHGDIERSFAFRYSRGGMTKNSKLLLMKAVCEYAALLLAEGGFQVKIIAPDGEELAVVPPEQLEQEMQS